MNELLLLLLGFVGIFAVGCSIALLALGKMIDEFPTGNETKRTRSIASPVETTRISVILFWALFVFGTWAVLQGSTLLMVTGITTFFAICLFMFTALVFSFAVLNALRNKKSAINNPVLQLSPQGAPAPVAAVAEPAPVIRKRYNNFFTDMMLNALLKKE